MANARYTVVLYGTVKEYAFSTSTSSAPLTSNKLSKVSSVFSSSALATVLLPNNIAAHTHTISHKVSAFLPCNRQFFVIHPVLMMILHPPYIKTNTNNNYPTCDQYSIFLFRVQLILKTNESASLLDGNKAHNEAADRSSYISLRYSFHG